MRKRNCLHVYLFLMCTLDFSFAECEKECLFHRKCEVTTDKTWWIHKEIIWVLLSHKVRILSFPLCDSIFPSTWNDCVIPSFPQHKMSVLFLLSLNIRWLCDSIFPSTRWLCDSIFPSTRWLCDFVFPSTSDDCDSFFPST